MLRVPDGRAGVQGVILLGQGHVNRQQQCSQVIPFTVGHIGQDGARFWAGIFYILGVTGYDTPIWDVLAREGEREEAARAYRQSQINQFFPN